MSISFVGSTGLGNGNTASPAATLPAGVVANDLIVVQYECASGANNGQAVSSLPNGFQLADQQQTNGLTVVVCYGFAAGGDPGPVLQWALSASSTTTTCVYRGVDQNQPFIAQQMAVQSISQTAMATPTLNNTSSSGWAATMFAGRQVPTPATWTAPSGLTQRQDYDTANSGSGNSGVAAFDSAGTISTGNHSYTATYSGATSQATGWLGILKPDTGAGASSGSATGTAAWTGTAVGKEPGLQGGNAAGTFDWQATTFGSTPRPIPYKVFLDDDSGTFPYDITDYVDLEAGFQIVRGRQNEFDEVQPSVLTMTLDNTDGRFTKGGDNDLYSVHVDQMIRVTCTVAGIASNRFTGYVSSWPIAWPGGQDYSEVQITANDRLSRLSRRLFKSVVDETILLMKPRAYYTLGEDQGATVAGDISGNQNASLVQSTTGTGAAGPTFANTPIAFGQGAPLADVNPTDPAPTVYFNPQDENNGKYLSGNLATSFTDYGLIHVTFNTGTVPSTHTIMAAMLDAGGNGLGVGINTTGNVAIYSISAHVPTQQFASPSTYHDDKTHDAVVFFFGGTESFVYVDGAQAGAGSALGGSTYTYTNVTVGGLSSSGYLYTGTLSHAAFYTSWIGSAGLGSTSDIFNAVSNGFVGDSTDARVGRYATWANIPTANQMLEAGSLTTTAHQDTTGMDALTAIQNVEDTELGLAFIDGSGDLVFQARGHRNSAPVAIVLESEQAGPDTQFLIDNQFLINYATVSRPLGPTIVALDQGSIDVHERYEWDTTVLTTNDTDSNSIATQKVNTYAEPLMRVPNLLIDALTESENFQGELMTLELSDLIEIEGLPTQAPGASFKLFIEGWTETYAITEWSIEFNTSPNISFSGSGGGLLWILGNSTYSILGATTELA